MMRKSNRKVSYEPRAAGKKPEARSSFLHNRIVAIADEPRAHGLGILPFGVGSDLNVIELVGGSIVRAEGRILLLLQSLNQRFGVFLPADGGDLHVVTAAARWRGGCGVCDGL